MWGDTATRVLLAVLTQDRPTVRSVAAEVGRSVSKTHEELVKLRAAGLVKWDAGKTGTLRPIVAVVAGDLLYARGTAHRSGAGAALTRNPAPWSARSEIKEGQRA